MMENGKNFPFFNLMQVSSINGHVQYPRWQLHGNFAANTPHVSPNCPDVLLQVGGQESGPEGSQFDQGGPLGQGRLDDRGHGNDIGEGGEEGQIVGNPPPEECEFERVCDIAKFLENWSDRALNRPVDQTKVSLECVQNVVVHPGTVQKVCVQWPVLTNDEFVELSEQRMLWEFCGIESDLKDEMCVQLVGGIAPLRVGQQARACQDVLFFNPGEKTVSILAGDVIGYAKLAGQGAVNPERRRAMESCNLVMTMGADRPAEQTPTNERVQHLVQQLGLMDNRLLEQHPEVRSKLIALVTRYESVFTDSDVAVGKTDVLKMKIVLESDVTPVRAAVRRIKPSLQR